ncbi:MAG: hypothetical protein R3F24_13730 [Gammaproteobacteria bacterium]
MFGILTVREGSAVLFWSEAARIAAGQYVPFVLWFNFLAGFAYVGAGIGLWFRQRWAAALAFAIAIATLTTFVALGIHVMAGNAYEQRTIVAMSLRSMVWIVISVVAWRFLWRSQRTGGL